MGVEALIPLIVCVFAEARNLRLNNHAMQERDKRFYVVRENLLCPRQESNNSYLDFRVYSYIYIFCFSSPKKISVQ